MGQKNPIEMVYEKSQGQGPSCQTKQEMQLVILLQPPFL